MPSKEIKTPEQLVRLLEAHPDLFEVSTFQQILEMEDDDENPVAFSKSIVADYFDQADLTFKQMDEYLEKQDLKNISKLGHFLKGSSATLGLTKLKDSCEKLQHYGDRLDEAGHNRVSDSQVSLRNCKKTIEQARREFKEVEDILQPFYQDD